MDEFRLGYRSAIAIGAGRFDRDPFCASFETVRQLSEVKSFTGSAANSNEPLLSG
jgi:hypothetical protein